jgi:7-cyano-7-deazaguanine synthase
MLMIESQNGAGTTVGLLLSGGLDSVILLHFLLDHGCRVMPFYIDFGLFWQADELDALRRYLALAAHPRSEPLVTLGLPLADVYGEHWSVTGHNVPDRSTPDDAVFLPGRNAFLVIKAAVWCQLHGIAELALATLQTSPFADAASPFFRDLESALNLSLSSPLRIVRPFAGMNKRQVMALGRDLPLERTFSCIAPVGGRHCGACNKCAERQEAFRLIGKKDVTDYAVTAGQEIAQPAGLRPDEDD